MGRHIYFHVPFCEAKCPYCSFYSIPGVRDGYKEAALKELKAYEILVKEDFLKDNNDDLISTVYFGGGTPSLPDSHIVCGLLKEAVRIFKLDEDAEKTIEVNPNSLTYEKLKDYKAAGFNRVSIGVQSLSDEVLKTLGRLHNSSQAIDAIVNARNAGFTNISADLIIGVPGQTLEMILSHADKLIELGVKHVSMYSLSIEEGTPFYSKYGDKLYEYMDEDLEREMYHGLRKHLSDNGIIPYEISNCAVPGFESRHNNSYWEGREYFAIGAGSHGYLNSSRYSNIEDVHKYIEQFNSLDAEDIASEFRKLLADSAYNYSQKIEVINVEERLTNEGKLCEYAMLMLRTTSGIDKKEFRKRFGIDLNVAFSEVLKSNKDKGLLTETDEAVFLSKKGLDLANQVFCDFV